MNSSTSIRKKRFSLGLAVLLLLAATSAVAQPLGPEPPTADEAIPMNPPGPDEDLLQDRRERVQERLRILRAWRLTEIIEMDELTGVQLFSLLDSYDERMEREQTLLGEMTLRLRTHLEEGTGSEEEIATLVEEIMAVHLRIEQLRVRLVQDSAAFLSARQRAALMLFLPEFDQEVRQMIREVRRERRREGRNRPDGAGIRPGPRQNRAMGSDLVP